MTAWDVVTTLSVFAVCSFGGRWYLMGTQVKTSTRRKWGGTFFIVLGVLIVVGGIVGLVSNASRSQAIFDLALGVCLVVGGSLQMARNGGRFEWRRIARRSRLIRQYRIVGELGVANA